ncbi:hypothetical protein NADFUDRAFT_52771 [Nadsonia fulvescens var. elongata DSM 6958]|uniref:Uncharacterized protein n=1 Tax=Nadsonia fulvescens var. elongata DSM 6958 TaxID=857566 RepID=A0A1E3PGB8_9ASCO|nr:hypothetical protein NADFUDRAFT_52771 [Nadsonia fulvescens var. elongata DSM 6958]
MTNGITHTGHKSRKVERPELPNIDTWFQTKAIKKMKSVHPLSKISIDNNELALTSNFNSSSQQFDISTTLWDKHNTKKSNERDLMKKSYLYLAHLESSYHKAKYPDYRYQTRKRLYAPATEDIGSHGRGCPLLGHELLQKRKTKKIKTHAFEKILDFKSDPSSHFDTFSSNSNKNPSTWANLSLEVPSEKLTSVSRSYSQNYNSSPSSENLSLNMTWQDYSPESTSGNEDFEFGTDPGNLSFCSVETPDDNYSNNYDSKAYLTPLSPASSIVFDEYNLTQVQFEQSQAKPKVLLEKSIGSVNVSYNQIPDFLEIYSSTESCEIPYNQVADMDFITKSLLFPENSLMEQWMNYGLKYDNYLETELKNNNHLKNIDPLILESMETP